MKSILMETIQLLSSNFKILSMIILTICLPINIITNYLDFYVLTENDFARSWKAYIYLDALLSPIYVGALIYALYNIKLGNSTSYSRAMAEGVKSWFNIFTARFIAGLLIFLGLLLFIIPGLILMVRYALLDMVVVAEQAGHDLARKRSSELTQGRRWEIVLIFIIFMFFILLLSTIISIPTELFKALDTIYYSILSDCFLDVISAFWFIAMFLLYWEAIQIEGDGIGQEALLKETESLKTDIPDNKN